ncbi:unnamed protein product [Gordionus sp. m RMFG-2023]
MSKKNGNFFTLFTSCFTNGEFLMLTTGLYSFMTLCLNHVTTQLFLKLYFNQHIISKFLAPSEDLLCMAWVLLHPVILIMTTFMLDLNNNKNTLVSLNYDLNKDYPKIKNWANITLKKFMIIFSAQTIGFLLCFRYLFGHSVFYFLMSLIKPTSSSKYSFTFYNFLYHYRMILLLIYWTILVIISFIFCLLKPKSKFCNEEPHLISRNSKIYTDELNKTLKAYHSFTLIINRKFFHLITIFIIAPGILMNPALTCVCSAAAFALLLELELFRYIAKQSIKTIDLADENTIFRRFANLFKTFNERFESFRDTKDLSSPLILSHIYLLVGMCLPFWISYYRRSMLLILIPESVKNASALENKWGIPTWAGIISVGIGDSAAAIAGSYCSYLKAKWLSTFYERPNLLDKQPTKYTKVNGDLKMNSSKNILGYHLDLPFNTNRTGKSVTGCLVSFLAQSIAIYCLVQASGFPKFDVHSNQSGRIGCNSSQKYSVRHNPFKKAIKYCPIGNSNKDYVEPYLQPFSIIGTGPFWIKITISLILNSFLEGYTSQNDNIIIPICTFYSFSLL